MQNSLGIAALLACGLNLVLISTLPTVLFKPGKKHFSWWLTASPLIVAGLALFAGAFSVGVWAMPTGLTSMLALVALILAAGSVGLIAWAGRSHRAPLALWHQSDDQPVELVTWGPYRHVRHPLYTAFLMTLAACVLAAPGWGTVLALGVGALQLNRTAAREERRISSTPLGRDYSAYINRTGRFVPRGIGLGSSS